MQRQTWEIDSSHSGIHFSVRHMVIAKVRGSFARWSGTVHAVDGDLAGLQIDAVIDAGSIDTGVAERDAHLKSPDFLDTAQFPEIRFQSQRVDKRGSSQAKVTGQLTIRGVSREIVLDVEYAGRAADPWGNERAGFTAKASLDRKEFGLTWNQALETGGLLVGDRVDIEIEVEAVKQAALETA